MPINETCPLVLNNLYFYDFKSCYSRLLENIGYDFRDVDLDNKTERNIYIGKIQRNNQELQRFLSCSVDSLIQYYLNSNDVDESNVIVSQKDGFILTKSINHLSDFMELEFRCSIDTLIITPDRKKFMYWCGSDVVIKGVSNFYDKLLDVYCKFINLNFYNKKQLFKQLEFIKRYVLNLNNKDFFIIPIGGNNVVQTKHGPVKIKSRTNFSFKSIDRVKYFNHYFKEFCDSIFLQFF